MDHQDHDPPWWTRSVQDHLGPRSDISVMHSPLVTWFIMVFLRVFAGIAIDSDPITNGGSGVVGLAPLLSLEAPLILPSAVRGRSFP